MHASIIVNNIHVARRLLPITRAPSICVAACSFRREVDGATTGKPTATPSSLLLPTRAIRASWSARVSGDINDAMSSADST